MIARAWTPQPVFRWLASAGGIADAEMLSVFNCGIGMVLVVPDADRAMAALAAQGEAPVLLGHVVASGGGAPVVRMQIAPDFGG